MLLLPVVSCCHNLNSLNEYEKRCKTHILSTTKQLRRGWDHVEQVPVVVVNIRTHHQEEIQASKQASDW